MKTIVFYRNSSGSVVQKSIGVPFYMWLRGTGDIEQVLAVVAVPRAK